MNHHFLHGVIGRGGSVGTTFKKSLLTDGINDFAQAANSSVHNSELVNTSGGLSFSGWVKFGSLTGTQRLFNKRQDTPTKGFQIFFSGGQFGFQLYDGSGDNDIDRRTATNPFTIGVWKHFVWTYDGSRLASGVTLYINGVSTAMSASSVNNENDDLSNPVTFEIAAGAGGAFPLFANQCDIAGWTKQLSAAEVGQVYNGGIRHNLNALAAPPSYFYYPCGDAPGDDSSTVVDLGPNAGNLTLLNGASFVLDSP